MKPELVTLLSKLVYENTGIVIQPEKSYLFETRLAPVMRRFKFASLDDMVTSLKSKPGQDLERAVFEAMTTNETYFFRDGKPFEIMKDLILPRLFDARQNTKRISIWSAACASGQEPYSLAMLLKEELKSRPGWSVSILATDVSSEMIERCKTGVYSHFEVQRGLPIQLLVKYFTEAGENWKVNQDIRQMVGFRQFNLLNSPSVLLEESKSFDVIFCRNVLIYFDMQMRSDILARFSKVIAKDGSLFLGGAETILGLTDLFESFPEERSVFRLARAA